MRVLQIIFSDHSVNIQRLGYAKPLKLVTTCMKPSRHDTSCFSVPQQKVSITHSKYRQVCLWIYRARRRKEASREAEPLPSCPLAVLLPPAAPKGCATYSRKGREVIIAQAQLSLGLENSCIHPLPSKGMQYCPLL